MDPVFFATPEELRAWFTEHHGEAAELWVGIHKKGSGLPSVTLAQAQDEALCVGWIDSVSKGIDGASYALRFTPRRARSNWSATNIKRVGELTAENRMLPAGLAAFARHKEQQPGTSHDPATVPALDEGVAQRLQSNEVS